MQENKAQVRQPGSGWTRITDMFLAPATGAVVQAYKDLLGLQEIGQYNGFTIMLHIDMSDEASGAGLLGIPRTTLAIRSSGPNDGDFRAACFSADKLPIRKSLAPMKKRINEALIAQLEINARENEPTGFERELPMYRGFRLLQYRKSDGDTFIIIRAHTAVAELYSAAPDRDLPPHPDRETAGKETMDAANDSGFTDEQSAKACIDHAYAGAFLSWADFIVLPLAIPPKDAAAT